MITIMAVLGGIYLKDQGNHQEPPSQSTSPSTDQQAEDQSDASIVMADQRFLEIPELGVKIKLDDQTEDLIYNVYPGTRPDGVAYLTLKSFLNQAEVEDYSMQDVEGHNSCKRLGSITIFNDQAELEEFYPDTEVIDPSGQLIKSNAYKMEDGRYYIVNGSQAMCGKSRTELTDIEIDTRQSIIELLMDSSNVVPL